MSYVSWHIYGYGICVSNITEKSVERLKKLLAMAPEVQKEVSEWLGDCGTTEPTYEDYMDFDQDFGLGLASILWKVIYIAEGIDLVACENYEGETYLLYVPDYPWHQKLSRQFATEEEAKQLIKKYVSVLTDELIDIDYQSVENGG